VPHRMLPWYFLASDGRHTLGRGVSTGPGAFACWMVDAAGISLWLDVRCGSAGVRLGERSLDIATIHALQSHDGESPFAAARRFCRVLCAKPKLPEKPVYGWNTWYYTYGKDMSADDVLRDARALAELAPARDAVRPFLIIDEGWGASPAGAGPWMGGGARFPDMAGLADSMKKTGVRPGIWVRPLYTTEAVPERWRLAGNRYQRPAPKGFAALDPSLPEVLAHVAENIRRIAGWGYELIKHDYTTFDILGRWGFQMDADLTNEGWQFANRGRTTAEIVRDFYAAVREAAGSALLIGCNTVGHLGAGLFEMQRIGDDNGIEWDRTRRMGVNALAFRMPQHNTFFAADADCVTLSKNVPRAMALQWLELLAASGTPLFVSAHPREIDREMRTAIRRAFEIATRPQPGAEPLDWMESATPAEWRLGARLAHYDWFGTAGVSPLVK
jgi:alpha-galactosidase